MVRGIRTRTQARASENSWHTKKIVLFKRLQRSNDKGLEKMDGRKRKRVVFSINCKVELTLSLVVVVSGSVQSLGGLVCGGFSDVRNRV
jgi:hypothetical protein